MLTVSILVVEDNPADLQCIKESLSESQNHTFDCLEAESLESALDLTTHNDFDVVLIDLELPDSYGMDTIRKVMMKLPHTAIIALSGLKDEDMAAKSIRFGAQDCLDKQHLSPMTLNKSIWYAIERKKGLLDKGDLLQDLDDALQRIDMLENLLPFCLQCNNIFGADNKWHTIGDCTNRFSVGQTSELICPNCLTDPEQHKA